MEKRNNKEKIQTSVISKQNTHNAYLYYKIQFLLWVFFSLKMYKIHINIVILWENGINNRQSKSFEDYQSWLPKSIQNLPPNAAHILICPSQFPRSFYLCNSLVTYSHTHTPPPTIALEIYMLYRECTEFPKDFFCFSVNIS